ncbi:MAG: hypothetical protein ACC650_03995 [Gammaproteobacteria bacterium]
MKRLFYFTGYRLSVLHWKGKALVGSSSFEPTESGLEQFRNYLLQTENIPGKFLVDVIEEDFRNEKIPHVGSRDRKAVINRLVDRYYRSSEKFCYSEIVGREKTGRKDDIVLMGAMTNPQLIQPWLSILDECEVALSGIWTLPLISKNLLKTIGANSGVVLLVSQQVNSNVRQSLFRDGKLVSSRQSIINQDINDISAIGSLAAPEVSRTIDFLRAQNLVATNEVIDLHILGSDEQLLSLKQSFKPNDRQTVLIHPVSDIHKKLGLRGVGEQFSDSIFAWLCLDKKFSVSNYGARKIFNRYHNKLAATALYAASLLVVITAVLLAELNISDAMEYEKSITLLKKEEQNYKQLYANKFKDFEEVFENAGVMNSAVDLAERITRNGSTSPLDFLISLSEILAKDGSSSLHIDRIEWKAINLDEKTRIIKKANFTGKDPVKHNAVVTGRIDDPEHDYRASIEHIQRIIEYLKASNRIEKVEVLQMPVDLRSESKFSTESGVDVRRSADTGTSGIFSFEITMKEADRV